MYVSIFLKIEKNIARYLIVCVSLRTRVNFPRSSYSHAYLNYLRNLWKAGFKQVEYVLLGKFSLKDERSGEPLTNLLSSQLNCVSLFNLFLPVKFALSRDAISIRRKIKANNNNNKKRKCKRMSLNSKAALVVFVHHLGPYLFLLFIILRDLLIQRLTRQMRLLCLLCCGKMICWFAVANQSVRAASAVDSCVQPRGVVTLISCFVFASQSSGKLENNNNLKDKEKSKDTHIYFHIFLKNNSK